MWKPIHLPDFGVLMREIQLFGQKKVPSQQYLTNADFLMLQVLKVSYLEKTITIKIPIKNSLSQHITYYLQTTSSIIFPSIKLYQNDTNSIFITYGQTIS